MQNTGRFFNNMNEHKMDLFVHISESEIDRMVRAALTTIDFCVIFLFKDIPLRLKFPRKTKNWKKNLAPSSARHDHYQLRLVNIWKHH